MKKNRQFTIYNDYTPEYDLTKFSIMSLWNVERDKEFRNQINNRDDTLYSFIRTVDGEGIININGKEMKVGKNDLLLCMFDDVLFLKPKTQTWEYRKINFRINNGEMPFFEKYKIYNVPFSEHELADYDKMYKIMQVYNEINIHIANLIFEIIIFNWIKTITKNVNKYMRRSKEINNALMYISDNLYKNITVEELAQFCLLSTRRFRELFRQETGVSPKQYIKTKRLEEVAFLLINTNASLEAITCDLNYSSVFYMVSEFKKHYGLTPGQYRKHARIYQ